MSRHERYGERDLRFSRWHRQLPGDFDWIDIDYCGYCHECKEPLMLMELARDVGQDWKATTVTRRVADAIGVPALLVLYTPDGDGISEFRIKRVAPTFGEFVTVTPAVLAEWIERQHDLHVCSQAEAEGKAA